MRPAGFTGTPMPKDEAAAANPAPGAFIDYLLKTGGRKVTLEIHDEKGGLVRRYGSADAAPKTDLAKLSIAPYWVEPPSTLSAAPGLHRFVWPLRYPDPAGEDVWEDGVWAPPGRYTVVLDVDGARLTQPLTVSPDPRVTLPPEAYAGQFELARRIEGARGRLARVTRENGALLAALGERRKGASPETVKAIDALQKRAEEIAGGSAWWLPPRSLTTLRAVGDDLNKLATAVDGADAAPSPDAVSRLREDPAGAQRHPECLGGAEGEGSGGAQCEAEEGGRSGDRAEAVGADPLRHAACYCDGRSSFLQR